VLGVVDGPEDQAADLVVTVKQPGGHRQHLTAGVAAERGQQHRGAAAAARLHADYQLGARELLGDVSSADLATFVSILDHVLERLRGAASATPS
jgi:hypothetical protein